MSDHQQAVYEFGEKALLAFIAVHGDHPTAEEMRNPDEAKFMNKVTLIAVDQRGTGHEIAALAELRG